MTTLFYALLPKDQVDATAGLRTDAIKWCSAENPEYQLAFFHGVWRAHALGRYVRPSGDAPTAWRGPWFQLCAALGHADRRTSFKDYCTGLMLPIARKSVEPLRSMPGTARATLIAVTGYGRENDRAASIATGFDHYFVKPADTAKLVNLLADIRID